MEFLSEYGLFLLKVMTIVIGIVIVMAAGAAAGRKATQDHLEVENLNKKYHKTSAALRSAVGHAATSLISRETSRRAPYPRCAKK